MARRIRNRNKKQDEDTLIDIVEVKESAGSFIDDNQNTIIGVVAALIIIFGGWMAYNKFVVAPKQLEAVDQMYKAQEQFERDSFSLALTNPGGGYSGFLDIIDNYGSTKAGNIALYYAGISYLNLGKFEAAIDYLKDYSPSGDITPVMKYGAMGDAHSELNDMGKAMSNYKKAVSTSNNDVLSVYYLKKIGLLHEKEGNIAEALAAYTRVKKEFPTVSLAGDIDKYIIRTTK